MTGRFNLKNMKEIIRLDELRNTLQSMSRKNLEKSRLPSVILDTIGDEKVTIFPFEISYVAANKLNYVPFPVFQSYSAYTPYLDRLNAMFVENEDKAPKYILMEWSSLDQRHPLMDVPLCWLSVFRHHAPYAETADFLLVKRRRRPVFDETQTLFEERASIDHFIRIPVSDSPVVVRIELKMKIRGMLTEILFRVPEVKMIMLKESGLKKERRVVPANLSSGLMINCLPFSLKEMRDLMNGVYSEEKITDILLTGDGLSMFESEAIIEFLELPQIKLKSKEPLKIPGSLSTLERSECRSEFFILNYINDHLITDYRSEIVIRESEKLFSIDGWAIDALGSSLADAVYVEIDGKIFSTYYGKERPDIEMHFRNPDYRYSGFETNIPLERIGRGKHTMTFKVINGDATAYYVPDATICFHVIEGIKSN